MQNFSKIAVLLTLIIKFIESFKLLAPKVLKANENEIVNGCGNSRADKMVKNLLSNIEATQTPIFLIFNAKKAFIQLKEAFIKGLILQDFDLECHIWIKMEALCYAISRVLSQLVFNQIIFGQVISNSKANLINADFGQ